ncbi:MAG: hypothetical protein JWR75_743 [Devosia sp.]|nr:hypothetical protein [Devosia sp.]
MKLKLLAATVMLLASSGASLANCYEDLGCTDTERFRKSDVSALSCQALWEVRNEIYYENGLCFQTKRAINFFGNSGCYVDDPANIKFNKFEQGNVDMIRSIEQSRGC